jgi:beta-N-acetylhexosaminidase
MFKPVISDVEGLEISADEKALFEEFRPFGFILFQRNCDNPDQVKALVAQMKECIGNDNAPILIDQEGGRVARLRPPHWKRYPAAGVYSRLYETNPDLATAAVQVHASLMAADLTALGINVDCFPDADIFYEGADKVIGDRSYGERPQKVAILARAAAEGMISSGVIPVMKHLPGHGRADVDSHKTLPVVNAKIDELRETDFIPFKRLNDLPCAMTAHVVFNDIDAKKCATISKNVIKNIIRKEIGFKGVLFSDDLSMRALSDDPAKNATNALKAGCDLAVHCNGTLEERYSVLKTVKSLKEAEEHRLKAIFAKRRTPMEINEEKLYAWLIDVVKEYE